MKKLLFVMSHIKGGGAEQMLCNICDQLKNRYDIQILSLYNSKSTYTKKLEKYTQLFSLDKYRKHFNFPLLRSIYSRIFDLKYFILCLFLLFVKKQKPDIVIAFGDGIPLKIVPYHKHSKNFAWVHTDILEDYRIKKTSNYISLYSKIYNSFDKTIFVSKYLESKFTTTLNIKNNICIPNAIDIEDIILKSKEDGLINKNNNIIQFIAIGRLSYEKGFDRIINSFAKLPEELRLKCNLTILGQDYGELNNLTAQINKYNLSELIKLAGFTPNPYATLKNADILLVPSRYEGFGLVIVEAMALNIPTIATNTTGASDILKNGKYGMIIPNEDDAFDSVLKTVILQPSILDIYKMYFKKRIEDYSISRLKNDLLKIL